MKVVTATKLARNFKRMLDEVEFKGEELIVTRNKQQVAKIVPGPAHLTALEAMADLYRTLPADAAASWPRDSRRRGGNLKVEARDPWAT